MNCNLSKAIIFAAGAVIGSAVTYVLVKNKYEKIAQEEIDSVKETFSKRKILTDDWNSEDVTPVESSVKDKPDIMEYAKRLEEYGYLHEQAVAKKAAEENQVNEEEADEEYEGEEEDSMEDEGFEVITAEEFEDTTYDIETLTYFADGVLTDWYNDPLTNADEYCPPAILKAFDDYADGDTIYIRNDNHMCNYEIQRDYRNYRDVFPDESTEA